MPGLAVSTPSRSGKSDRNDPSIWSKEWFSSIRTTTCLIGSVGISDSSPQGCHRPIRLGVGALLGSRKAYGECRFVEEVVKQQDCQGASVLHGLLRFLFLARLAGEVSDLTSSSPNWARASSSE